jgi:hypothetical protein
MTAQIMAGAFRRNELHQGYARNHGTAQANPDAVTVATAQAVRSSILALAAAVCTALMPFLASALVL